MRKLFLLGLLASGLLLAGCSDGPGDLEQRWLTFYQQRDAGSLIRLYTEQALLERGGQVHNGRGAITNYWNTQMAASPVILQLQDVQRVQEERRVVVNASYLLLRAGSLDPEAGRFIQVWVTNGVDWFIQEERWLPVG